MKPYNLEIELLSPTLAGSGLGFGAAIDTDIVFDDHSIPFIPAKRIKGCLRDSIREILDMFSIAGIGTDKIDLKKTFGETGKEKSAQVYFSNFCIPDYEKNRAWLRYFSDKYRVFITHNRIIKNFTEIHQQTKIDENGVAYEHSLRTIRVLRKGLKFIGKIYIEADEEWVLNTLLLASHNFKHMGTKRNRGYGEICCRIYDPNRQLLNADRLLEALCIP